MLTSSSRTGRRRVLYRALFLALGTVALGIGVFAILCDRIPVVSDPWRADGFHLLLATPHELTVTVPMKRDTRTTFTLVEDHSMLVGPGGNRWEFRWRLDEYQASTSVTSLEIIPYDPSVFTTGRYSLELRCDNGTIEDFEIEFRVRNMIITPFHYVFAHD